MTFRKDPNRLRPSGFRPVSALMQMAISLLLFFGCADSPWGVIPDDSTPIAEGWVTSDGEGLEGIEVCAHPAKSNSGQPVCDYSDAKGWYGINSGEEFAEQAAQSGFLLAARDIDGFDNGYYAAQDIHVSAGHVPATITIELLRTDE